MKEAAVADGVPVPRDIREGVRLFSLCFFDKLHTDFLLSLHLFILFLLGPLYRDPWLGNLCHL